MTETAIDRMRVVAWRVSNSPRWGLPGLCFVVIGSGCAPVMRLQTSVKIPAHAITIDDEELSECRRRRSGDAWAHEQLDEPTQPAPALAELPPELRRVVEAARVEPLLAALLHGDASNLVALELQLVMQLSSLELQVSSLLFEANCHGAQMDAVSRELDRRQQAQDVGLTVASILVAGVVGTAGGIWETQTTDEAGPAALLITGGAVSAMLGIAAFIPDRQAIVFPHRVNLLTPIVRGEDPDQRYPSFVFRMLLAPDHDTTIRDDILADWQELIDARIPEHDRALAESLLYGDGGIYDGRLLELREEMFDVLESHIYAIDQDLELLYRYSAHVVEVDRAP